MDSPETPLFSIVTVCLNNLAGLKETGDSLKSQTSQNFEWLVIDGGSVDGTGAWLRNQDCIFTSEPDKGLYDAMNKGVERASGKYLLFLNAGDALAKLDTIEDLSVHIRQNEFPDFIYGDALDMGENRQMFLKKARSHPRIANGMFTRHQAMIYKREAIGSLRHDLSLEIAADYDFTARFLALARNVVYCPGPVCVFEPGGISERHAARGRLEEFRIRRNLALCGYFQNILAYVRQSAAYTLKRHMPAFYFRLRRSIMR